LLPNWFALSAQANFERFLTPSFRENLGTAHVLQIGAYAGHASEWLLDNFLDISKGDTLTDVDTWEGSPEEAVHSEFDWSAVHAEYMERTKANERTGVYPRQTTSDDFFEFAPQDPEFNVIYVDGNHSTEQVARDAHNAHMHLQPGGYLIFDDYLWNAVSPPEGTTTPKPAIDAFLTAHALEYEVILYDYQVWLRKLPGTSSRRPKVAVYTIAKNEEQFVRRWYDSARQADYLLITDTGSTDNTVQIARDLGIHVNVNPVDPWRFDVARNLNLSQLPDDIDYCIALDMDEVLLPGWRDELERVFARGATRPRYKYAWSVNPDGSHGLMFSGDKIHARHNYTWRHPVHETLTPTTLYTDVHAHTDIVLEHHPDPTKSRAQYLPLLQLSVEEDPDNDRNAFYYARELMFYGHYNEAITQFQRHLSLPTARWRPERCASMRYISRCLLASPVEERTPAETEAAFTWLIKACNESPDRREPWVELAQLAFNENLAEFARHAIDRAAEITVRPLEYLCEEHAWGPQFDSFYELLQETAPKQ